MLVNFKNNCIAEASMEEFSVPIERGVNTGAQSKHTETQQINQKNNSQVDIKSEILAVDPCIDGTHQNKSFCCNFHPPKNLSEHARRRGDVNRILRHKEGKEWASSPSPHRCGARQESVGTQGIGIGGGTGAPPSALQEGFAESVAWVITSIKSRPAPNSNVISQNSIRTFLVMPFF